MLEIIRKSLRITTTKFDDEILLLIDSCKQDLSISGVNVLKISEEDSLYKMATILYCKSKFGLDDKMQDKYWESYVILKTQMSLAKEYLYE